MSCASATSRERPSLSLNRGFSAPITLSIEQTQEERAFLARHDSDPFSRWQAFNSLLTDALMVASRQCRGGKEPEFPDELIDLAGAIAGNETLEPAFRALALALPGEADIARELGTNIDPDAIFAAREALAKAIADANAGAVRTTVRRVRRRQHVQPRRGERRAAGAAQRRCSTI